MLLKSIKQSTIVSLPKLERVSYIKLFFYIKISLREHKNWEEILLPFLMAY